jgi:DNA repair protein RadC
MVGQKFFMPHRRAPRKRKLRARLTHSVNMAASTMQIQFLDHLIIGAPAEGRAAYFSFKEAGLL